MRADSNYPTNTFISMNKRFIPFQAASALAMIALTAAPAFAEINVTAGAKIGAPGMRSDDRLEVSQERHDDKEDRHAEKMDDRMDRMQDRGGAKIDLRLNSLNDLVARINSMSRISAADKASLSAMIQAQIDALTNLKAKINADADPATIKADNESIAKAYRIFMLVEPKGRIIAAGDRALAIGASFATLSTKLQANIATAASSGKDISALNASLADMNAKVSDSNAKANAAISLVTNLQPDNGNAAVAASNKTAIENAKANIKTSNADLKAAHADAKSIVKTLHDWKIVANASVSNQ